MTTDGIQDGRPRRPWCRLHSSTWLLFALLITGMTLVVVPGEYTGRHMFDYLFSKTTYEHGWPFVYLRRINSNPPPTFKGPPWLLAESWPFRSRGYNHQFSLSWFALDVLISTALVAFVVFVFEWWRRRRRRIWNFSIKELFIGSLCVAVVLAWYAYHRRAANHQDAFLTWNDAQGDVVGVEKEFIGPFWMGRLVGRERLGIFWRIVGVDAYAYSDQRDQFLQAFARLDELTTVESVCFSRYDASIETLLRDSSLLQRVAHIKLVSPDPYYYKADDAIDSLLNLRQLRRLTVNDDSFSPGGLDRLRRGLPNCTVEAFGMME